LLSAFSDSGTGVASEARFGNIPLKTNPFLRPTAVLTGGPGGGKTTLIDELLRDPAWGSRVAALPEAISLMRHLNISPRERLFQRVMVHLQLSLEDGLHRALGPDDPRLILCHRGTLDPLAYWLDGGWPEGEFFAFTETQRQDLYRRYAAVIHLVTAADGAAWAYKRWPEAHRPEGPPDAIRIDRLLQQAWGGHPKYFRIDNEERDWAAKSKEAREILSRLL
jgi:AAA domain